MSFSRVGETSGMCLSERFQERRGVKSSREYMVQLWAVSRPGRSILGRCLIWMQDTHAWVDGSHLAEEGKWRRVGLVGGSGGLYLCQLTLDVVMASA